MTCSIPCPVPTTISCSSELTTKQVGSEENVDNSLLQWNTQNNKEIKKNFNNKRSLSKWHAHLLSWWCWWSLFNHSTTRTPPFSTRPCAQVWAEVSRGSLSACWMQRFGQEESRRAWRCRKLQQSSRQAWESPESTKRNSSHKGIKHTLEKCGSHGYLNTHVTVLTCTCHL